MRLAQPEMSKNQIDLLMLILDMNRSGHIGKCMRVAVEIIRRIRIIKLLYFSYQNSNTCDFLLK